MAGPGLIYQSGDLYAKEDEMILKWNITGAKTSTPLPLNRSSVMTVYDAIAAQATIDNFLGTTNEFLIAQFDATAMGTDAFGFLINMSGGAPGLNTTTNRAQAAQLLCVEVTLHSGSQGATAVNEGVASIATLTSSSLATEFALGSYGNIAGRAILSGLDILTTGIIVARLHWVSQ